VALPPELVFITDLVALYAVYLIVSLSLNLEYGYAGIPNFGKMLAVAGGAFVAGALPGRLAADFLRIPVEDYVRDNVIIVTQVNVALRTNASLALSILLATLIVAAGVGAALGFIASYPARRLREDYLAITLLAMAEGIRVIGYNYPPLVGGTLGVQVADTLAWVTPELRYSAATLLLLAVAIIVLVYMHLTVNSPLGRALRAIRDSEIAAATLGKDIVRTRMQVLVVGSALGALGGALYGLYAGGVIATAYDRVTWTFWPWVMVVLGGAANNLGVSLGTLIFVTFRKLITFYKGALGPYLPFDPVWLDLILLGIVLTLILMYRPQGLLPAKPIFTISRDEIQKIAETKAVTSDRAKRDSIPPQANRATSRPEIAKPKIWRLANKLRKLARKGEGR